MSARKNDSTESPTSVLMMMSGALFDFLYDLRKVRFTDDCIVGSDHIAMQLFDVIFDDCVYRMGAQTVGADQKELLALSDSAHHLTAGTAS